MAKPDNYRIGTPGRTKFDRDIGGRTTARPPQKIPQSKKTKEWGMHCVEWFGAQSTITPQMRNEMRVLYRLSSGELDEDDYTHVLYPYGNEQRKRSQLQGDPARMRNYDIISPVISRMIGDFVVRDTSFSVVATNSDVEDRRQAMIKDSLRSVIIQQFQNDLALQTGGEISTGFEQDPAQMEDMMMKVEETLNKAENIPDAMTVKGQNSLDYIRYYNEIDRKIRTLLYDYLTVGRMYTLRDVFRSDTVFDVYSPMQIDYIADEHCEYIEDGEAAWSLRRMTVSDVIDKFREELDDDEIDWLESHYGGFTADSKYDYSSTDMDYTSREGAVNILMGNIFADRKHIRYDGVEVRHVTWRSKRKLGFLTSLSLTGDGSQTIEVTEDYKPMPGDEIIWEWVDEVWEGYNIADRFYKYIRPLPIQRGTAQKPSAKLPYNGRVFGNRGAIPNTPVKKGRSHQELYNIIKYRMERTMAKNKDKMTVMPYGIIPDDPEADLDMFSMMYYGDYHGYLFVDESDPKKLQALNALKVLDGSMREYIKFLHDIATTIRLEYMEIAGIPRQKMADIKASDDVGNTQFALAQGSLILEEMFLQVEDYLERDFQCLLDLSKYAWAEGKKAQFLNPQGELNWLDVAPLEMAAVDLSIFVKGNKQEREKLNTMRQLTQAFAQNSATPTMVGKILQANNFDALMRSLDDMEKAIQSQQAEASRAQQVAAEAQNAIEQQKLDFQKYKTDEDNQTRIEVASIQANSQLAGALTGAPVEGVDTADVEKEFEANQARREELNVKRSEIAQKHQDSINKVKIAKENKNRFDK